MARRITLCRPQAAAVEVATADPCVEELESPTPGHLGTDGVMLQGGSSLGPAAAAAVPVTWACTQLGSPACSCRLPLGEPQNAPLVQRHQA